MYADLHREPGQTITIETPKGHARQMSVADLRQLGAGQVAYARPAHLCDGLVGYALYRGDGTPLDLVCDLESLIALLEQHGLALVALQ